MHCDAPDECSGLDGSRVLAVDQADGQQDTDSDGILVPVDDPADFYEMEVPADLVRSRIRVELSFSQLEGDAELSLFEPACADLIATTKAASSTGAGILAPAAKTSETPTTPVICTAETAERGLVASVVSFFAGLFGKARSACAEDDGSASSSAQTIHADVNPRECVEDIWDFRIKLFGPHGSASVPETITVEWDDGETLEVSQFRGQPVGAEHAKYRTDAKLDRAVVDARAEVDAGFEGEFYLQQGVCFPEPEPPESGQEAGTWFVEFTPTQVGLYVVAVELADDSGEASTQREGARFCHEGCLGLLMEEFGYDLDTDEQSE